MHLWMLQRQKSLDVAGERLLRLPANEQLVLMPGSKPLTLIERRINPGPIVVRVNENGRILTFVEPHAEYPDFLLGVREAHIGKQPSLQSTP